MSATATASSATWLTRRLALPDLRSGSADWHGMGSLAGLGGLRLVSLKEVSDQGRALSGRINPMSSRQRNRLVMLCHSATRVPVWAAAGKESEELLTLARMLAQAFDLQVSTSSAADRVSVQLTGEPRSKSRASGFVDGDWLEIESVRVASKASDAAAIGHVGVEFEFTLGETDRVASDFDGLLLHGKELVLIEAKARHALADADEFIGKHVASRFRKIVRWSGQRPVAAHELRILFVLVGPALQRKPAQKLEELVTRAASTARVTPTVVVTGLSGLRQAIGEARERIHT